MLKMNTNQKKEFLKLTDNGHRRWTLENLERAIHIIYGKRVTILKVVGGFNGVNTKFQLACNECQYGTKKDGTQWIKKAKLLIHHPTCPRCMFDGKCHKLGYTIIQKRLDKKHSHIKIFPIHHHLYKNQTTKVWAYDDKVHEWWVESVNNLLSGKGAPKNSHKKGYKKESQAHSYEYYCKEAYKKWPHQISIKPKEKFHSKSKSSIVVTNLKDGYSWETNFEELLQIKRPKTRPKYLRNNKH